MYCCQFWQMSCVTAESIATIIELPCARKLVSDFASEILPRLSHFFHDSEIRSSSQDLCWDSMCSSLVLGNFWRIEGAIVSASQSKTCVIFDACQVRASGSSGSLSSCLRSEMLPCTVACTMWRVGQIHLCLRIAGEAQGLQDPSLGHRPPPWLPGLASEKVNIPDLT